MSNKKPDVEKLVERIRAFLSERKESVNGGYAVVTGEDMGELTGIFQAIIEAKWQSDCDGDSPVEFDVVDRTRFERLHGCPIPYPHKTTTEKEKDECVNRAMINAATAMEILNRHWQARQCDKRSK